MVANMANTFFWKHNDEVERRCKTQINSVKAMVNSLVTSSMMLMPFGATGILAAESALELEAVAVASEETALQAAKAAEEAAVQEAVVAEESVAAAEAETLAQSNLAEAERETAAHAASEQASVSDEQAALAERQRQLQAELRQAQNHQTLAAARKEQLELEAKKARLHAIIDREAAVRDRKKVYEKGWGKFMYPAPWAFTRFTRNARGFAAKLATGKHAWTVYAFTGVPLVVSYHLGTLVAHFFYDLMRVSNVDATDRRK